LLSQLPPGEKIHDVTSPYYLFKYSVRSELRRKYYERRIKKFFDFIGFSVGSVIEKRCNLFAQKGRNDSKWATLQVIRFLQFEKENTMGNSSI
jgi:hypothetical protein